MGKENDCESKEMILAGFWEVTFNGFKGGVYALSGVEELCFRMRRGQKEPEPRRIIWDSRIDDGLDINS